MAFPSTYPTYKPSGTSSLGDVPEHWDVVQLGRIGVFSKGSGGTKDDEVPTGIPCVRYGDLYTTHKYFITQARSFIAPKKATQYTKIQRGDILFPTSGETIEDIGRSAANLIDSPVCCGGDLIIFRSTVPVEPRFAGYALDCPHSQDQKSRMGRGVSIMHIYSNQLKYLWLALPPLDEQGAIVRYLDDADQRIRAYVSAKERLIALLEEEKQALIQQAVTRGLDPNVRVKPSGVEWLGDVPMHWEVGALKRFVAKWRGSIKAGPFGSQLTASEMTETDFKVYTQRNVIDRDLKKGSDYISSKKFSTLRAFKVVPGDVLITSRGTIGRTVLVPEGCERGILHPCLLRVHPDGKRLVPEFLMTLIQDSQILQQQLTFLSNATTIDVIYTNTLANIVIPVPPLNEQTTLLKELNKATTDINTSIDLAHSQIDLMNEYRTRLIADVVTGKLDVREAAGQLPDPDGEDSLTEHQSLSNPTINVIL